MVTNGTQNGFDSARHSHREENHPDFHVENTQHALTLKKSTKIAADFQQAGGLSPIDQPLSARHTAYRNTPETESETEPPTPFDQPRSLCSDGKTIPQLWSLRRTYADMTALYNSRADRSNPPQQT